MAHIHGHQSFADYALVSRMAKNPANVADLLGQVWPAALKRSRQEQQLLLSVAKADGLTALEAWDWRYYAEKVRLRDYQLDDGEIKPYFTLDNMLQAMFYAAGRLYQVSFQEVTGTAPLYHPDARLFEMRRDDGSLQGIFISDNYSRTGKHSGAWMSNYREQSEGVLPIVSNNNNFTQGKPGEPVLLSFDDVETLFHEFGHALHSLLSEVKYEGLSGTNVLQDFVELPSQLNEHWALAPEVLAKFAKHVDTGASIPPALVEKVRKARTFNMGWETVQYLGPALLDMALHSLGDANGFDAALFEREESQRLGVPSEIGLRHRLPHFQHLFTGEGYAAGYYVYMWAEVLEADVFSAFEEKGDLFDPELSARLKATLLSIGNSVDPAQAFRNFRGRDPQISALLKQRGLA
jgi:peptidyl-dipeptidase Dcp